MYVTPLLWATMYNLSGPQAAVKEQVGQLLLTRVGKHVLEGLPDLTAVGALFPSVLSWVYLSGTMCFSFQHTFWRCSVLLSSQREPLF